MRQRIRFLERKLIKELTELKVEPIVESASGGSANGPTPKKTPASTSQTHPTAWSFWHASQTRVPSFPPSRGPSTT